MAPYLRLSTEFLSIPISRFYLILQHGGFNVSTTQPQTLVKPPVQRSAASLSNEAAGMSIGPDG